MTELYASPRRAFLVALFWALILTAGWWYITKYINLGIYPLLVGYGIVLLYAAYHYIRAKHQVIFLHDSHLQYRHGIVNIETINIPYAKVDNVRTSQSLFDRILGLIRVEIDTPGEKIVEIVFPNADAKQFKEFYKEFHKKLEEVKSSGGL